MSEGAGLATGGLGRWQPLLLAAVFLVGAVLRMAAFTHHHAIDYDEGRYLDNAVHIMEGRGLATSYTSHFFRDAPPIHEEDISAPLFPWILAATFTFTGAEHRAAQLWGVMPGCLLVLATFMLGRRLFDERTALLASLLVALNPDFVIISSWAMTEQLFALLLIGILALADRPRAGRVSPGRWVALGLACGALYLLRANGLAVAAAIGLLALMESGGAGYRRLVPVLAFAAGLAVVTGPWLLVKPEFSAMRHVAWTEDGRDLFTPGRPAPTMSTFRERHGGEGLAANLALRAGRAAGYLVWGDTGGYNLFCALFPAALALTWRERRLWPGHLAVLLSALLLAGVPVWTGALSRYLLPVRPWIYLTVIGAALQLVPAMAWRRGLRRTGGEVRLTTEPARRLSAAGAATVAALVAWLSAGPLQEYIYRDEQERDAAAREASAWLRDTSAPGTVLMEGAWLHQYAFLFRRPVVWTPASGDLGEVLATARDRGADHLAVSEELLRSRPGLRRHFVATERGIQAADLPEGFVEVYAAPLRRVVIWKLPAGAA